MLLLAAPARGATVARIGEVTVDSVAFNSSLKIGDIPGESTIDAFSTRDLSQTALAPMTGSLLELKVGW